MTGSPKAVRDVHNINSTTPAQNVDRAYVARRTDPILAEPTQTPRMSLPFPSEFVCPQRVGTRASSAYEVDARGLGTASSSSRRFCPNWLGGIKTPLSPVGRSVEFIRLVARFQARIETSSPRLCRTGCLSDARPGFGTKQHGAITTALGRSAQASSSSVSRRRLPFERQVLRLEHRVTDEADRVAVRRSNARKSLSNRY